MEKMGGGSSGGSGGSVTRGSLRPYGSGGSKSQSFVVLGLLVAVLVLGFNYWTATTRANKLHEDMLALRKQLITRSKEFNVLLLEKKNLEKVEASLMEERRLVADLKLGMDKFKTEADKLRADNSNCQNTISKELDSCKSSLVSEKDSCVSKISAEKESCKKAADETLMKQEETMRAARLQAEQACLQRVEATCKERRQEQPQAGQLQPRPDLLPQGGQLDQPRRSDNNIKPFDAQRSIADGANRQHVMDQSGRQPNIPLLERKDSLNIPATSVSVAPKNASTSSVLNAGNEVGRSGGVVEGSTANSSSASGSQGLLARLYQSARVVASQQAASAGLQALGQNISAAVAQAVLPSQTEVRRSQSDIVNDAKEEGRDVRAANLPRDNDTKSLIRPLMVDASRGETHDIVSKMGAVEIIKGASTTAALAASKQEADEDAYEANENEADKSAVQPTTSAASKTVQQKESPAKDSPVAVDSLSNEKSPSEPMVATNDAVEQDADQDGGRDVGPGQRASLARGVKLGIGNEEADEDEYEDEEVQVKAPNKV